MSRASASAYHHSIDLHLRFSGQGFRCLATSLRRLAVSDPVLAPSSIFNMLICIERNGIEPNGANSTMKLRMDETLRFWAEVACENIQSSGVNLTKRQLLAEILQQYERRGALRLRHITPFNGEEPFAATIRCTSDADKRTRSKWTRALRYAISRKPIDEPLDQFIQRKGGINECVARLTQQMSRRSGKM